MDFNWFTFGAQIINFLVLVALLKWFLYAPVIRAMDEREQNVADRLTEAEQRRQQAEQEQETYRRKTEQLQHQREELQAEAGREIEAWRKQHLQQAREEIEAARQEWYQALNREREQFLRDLRIRAGRAVYETARQVLTRLAGAPLEEQIVQAFLRKIGELTPDSRREIADAICNSHHRMTVASAFDLTEPQQKQIRSTLQETLADHAEITFRHEADLICGIEFKAAGYKVAWSVRELLESLEDEFTELLEQAARAPEPP